NLASGMLIEFETNLRTALEASVAINTENSLKHGVLLLDAAELYSLNGSFKTAKDFLINSKKILDNQKATDAVNAKWNVAMATVNTGQGFYSESLQYLWAAKSYFSTRTAKMESYVDDKGNLKSRKIPEQ